MKEDVAPKRSYVAFIFQVESFFEAFQRLDEGSATSPRLSVRDPRQLKVKCFFSSEVQLGEFLSHLSFTLHLRVGSGVST